MIQRVIGIDPGPTQSALVVFDGTRVEVVQIASNEEIIHRLRTWSGDPLAIERIASMGMTVGESVFETAHWSGRFCEAYDPSGELIHRIKRIDVKMHLCGTPRSKDSNVRQSLIDKFGGREKAIGKKAAPGPLYGISSHAWSALAVAVVWYEKNC